MNTKQKQLLDSNPKNASLNEDKSKNLLTEICPLPTDKDLITANEEDKDSW